jgi:hypothetical protein
VRRMTCGELITCGDREMMGVVGRLSMDAMIICVDGSASEADPWCGLQRIEGLLISIC